MNPQAREVLLAGDFTDWQRAAIPMKRSADGVWSASVSLGPGTHAYLFIVDGAWCEDPACGVRIPNPYGGLNMVRQVA